MGKTTLNRNALNVAVEHVDSLRHSLRHPLTVRITHWIFALAFFFLVFSSLPILIAHPRFYWGETGAIGTHPLFVLPLPLWVGRSGWGRNMHFLAAWISLFVGLLYVGYSILSQHFRSNLLPARADFTISNLRRVLAEHQTLDRTALQYAFRYNVFQRLAYLTVVFVLFPLIFLSGLAMSPAITSVVPSLVVFFGGHQSARTIHFCLASVLVGFFALHVLMVVLAGFAPRTKAMVTGQHSIGKIDRDL